MFTYVQFYSTDRFIAFDQKFSNNGSILSPKTLGVATGCMGCRCTSRARAQFFGGGLNLEGGVVCKVHLPRPRTHFCG